VAFVVVYLGSSPRRNSVSITRIGSTKDYAENWGRAFGAKKKRAAKKTTTKKAGTSRKKAGAKKR
jgi:hypothetical protein